MEDTLRDTSTRTFTFHKRSLNSCCNGRYSQRMETKEVKIDIPVLILVVMEDTLRDDWEDFSYINDYGCLNPCCNGRYSQSARASLHACDLCCLNPCCNGRYSQRRTGLLYEQKLLGLNPCCNGRYSQRDTTWIWMQWRQRLNPCCNGRYSQSYDDSSYLRFI